MGRRPTARSTRIDGFSRKLRQPSELKRKLSFLAVATTVTAISTSVAPNWCVDRPALVKLAEKMFQRESFARTVPPGTV